MAARAKQGVAALGRYAGVASRRLCEPKDARAGWAFGAALIFADCLLTAGIIWKVPYTEIDWVAYMQEVEGWLGGECDYKLLRGDTGPLVYPAGFVYIFAGLREVTGGEVFPAQIIFAAVYVATLIVVVALYVRAGATPPWALGLLVLSKRVHSIYVLRLFNDTVAMLLFYVCMLALQKRRWKAGLLVYSLAVSVKMNVLLMAPALLMLLLKGTTLANTAAALGIAAAVQLALGWPFLACAPMSYLTRSFDLGRKFVFHWSVNFKFLSEEVFLHKYWGMGLLAMNLVLLFKFASRKWCSHEGGIVAAIRSNLKRRRGGGGGGRAAAGGELTAEHVTTVMFTANFIGVVCARTLHYQFYCWYFHTLPYLLWTASWHSAARCAAFVLIEICWNVFPSTPASSGVLLWCHVMIMADLWHAAPRPPTVAKAEEGKGAATAKKVS